MQRIGLLDNANKRNFKSKLYLSELKEVQTSIIR